MGALSDPRLINSLLSKASESVIIVGKQFSFVYIVH